MTGLIHVAYIISALHINTVVTDIINCIIGYYGVRTIIKLKR